MSTVTLQMQPVLNLTEEQFFRFCRINRYLRIERNAQREIIVMSPTGGLLGRGEMIIMFQVEKWSSRNGTGTAFSCNTGFRLPNGAMRSPDASWISNSRLAKLTKKELTRFIPLCPEFVVELKSPTDRMNDLSAKMEEYIANGSKLGLLIIPEKKRVLIYRPDQPMQQVDKGGKIKCTPLLPGFELDVREIW